MAQAMDVAEAESVLLTKLREPEVRCVVVHRKSIPFHEEPVRFYPLISGLLPVSVLLRLELPEHIHYYRREFKCTLRLLRLGRVGVDTVRLAGAFVIQR